MILGRLFGTDGIRGNVGTVLTAQLAFELGAAGATILAKTGEKKPSMLIGMDTRKSSDMLAAALAAGICSVGVDVYLTGVVPTPAVAYLVRKYELSAGVMVSASHNAFGDNGIKFYDGQGHKLTDETENKIEAVLASKSGVQAQGANVGSVFSGIMATADYVDFLYSVVSTSLAGKRIALDCANGATFMAAPGIFEMLGAKTTIIGNKPDGVNINEKCGSTHMEMLTEHVKSGDYNMGFAFDGDGDRCFAVDENGNVIDGDMIMAIIGKHWQSQGKLAKNTIVATVMSNLGFFNDIEAAGLTAVQTKVGDRYVMERMMAEGYSLGGEQSGHIVCLDHHTTGDGILTALLLAGIVQETGKALAQLNTMQKMPQVLKNARLGNATKEDIEADAGIQAAISALHKQYEGRGRVLIRPSGTEPLIRVMIEGANPDEITKDAEQLVQMMEEFNG